MNGQKSRRNGRSIPRAARLEASGRWCLGGSTPKLAYFDLGQLRSASRARVDLSRLIAKASLEVRIDGEFEFVFWDEAGRKGRRRARAWGRKLGRGLTEASVEAARLRVQVDHGGSACASRTDCGPHRCRWTLGKRAKSGCELFPRQVRGEGRTALRRRLGPNRGI